MKRILLILVLLLGFTAVSLSAWEPNDLTKFPPGMNEKNWIINLGVGLGSDIGTSGYYTHLPSFKVTVDKNVGISDKKLPFFFGGLAGYTGHGYDGYYKWFNHRIPLGFRAGYHFNWGVKNLDTYAVTTAGWIIDFYTGDNVGRTSYNNFLFDIDIGARWFLNNFFGFWAELGFGTLSYLDIGVSFKF